jgi:hypothetical protein
MVRAFSCFLFQLCFNCYKSIAPLSIMDDASNSAAARSALVKLQRFSRAAWSQAHPPNPYRTRSKTSNP